MGLTIHYSLRSTCRSDAAARHHVERLRDRAMDLPFQQVGGLIDLSGEDCDFERLDPEHPHRWLLVQANEHVTHGERGYSVPPKRLIAFETSPGEGCEPANFGLCRYPSTVVGRDGRSIRTGLTGWRWRSFCKTQYASNPAEGGLPNFLRCHLSIVRLLDHARELGLLGDVSDEGGYWEKRDVAALAREVSNWNEMVAGFVGRVNDWIGAEGQASESPITAFPDFEHLEARGRAKSD